MKVAEENSMDPDLAKRVNAVVAPSPFVLQSSALHGSDDAEDVCVAPCCHFTISVCSSLLVN